jgi:nitrate/nitrite transport system ATP-binding protein
MTNAPGAVLAEIVDNPLPQERRRADLHRHPVYYGVRNHIVDFLVTRSRNFGDEAKARHDRRRVPVVRPGAVEPVIAAGSKPAAPTWRGAARPSPSVEDDGPNWDSPGQARA